MEPVLKKRQKLHAFALRHGVDALLRQFVSRLRASRGFAHGLDGIDTALRTGWHAAAFDKLQNVRGRRNVRVRLVIRERPLLFGAIDHAQVVDT